MKKVLVVEDDPVQQKHICTVLASCGVEVVVASDGKQGLEKAKSEQPDLIFMDIVMPEMDGFSACRQITSNDDTKDIPVVIVSSKKEEADKVWAQLQGATAMIAKPFTEDDLLVQINALA
ncbi:MULTISPECIES: response regulator [unclassified Neptuniibacter]|uniref:response regulator n=1 Tax=unclassified Neptuniibacter TaxID=2630693 RepID=UPI000C5757A3|nr:MULTISPECIES: response regulator [unclassified Neptuniibacter]MAY42895.1 two-component system response regulator [Oceanospirillaceae bacterium]